MKITPLTPLLAAALLLSQCTTMEPEGVTEVIADGDLFNQEVVDPGPPDNRDIEPLEKAPVRWKIPL